MLLLKLTANVALLFFTGNSSLDEDDVTLLSEGQNLHNELQIQSIRLIKYTTINLDLDNFK